MSGYVFYPLLVAIWVVLMIRLRTAQRVQLELIEIMEFDIKNRGPGQLSMTLNPIHFHRWTRIQWRKVFVKIAAKPRKLVISVDLSGYAADIHAAKIGSRGAN